MAKGITVEIEAKKETIQETRLKQYVEAMKKLKENKEAGK